MSDIAETVSSAVIAVMDEAVSRPTPRAGGMPRGIYVGNRAHRLSRASRGNTRSISAARQPQPSTVS